MNFKIKNSRFCLALLFSCIFASCADDLQSDAKFSQGMDRCIFEAAVKVRISKHAKFADFAVNSKHKNKFIPKLVIERAEGFALENMQVNQEMIAPKSKVFSFRRNSDLDCYIKLKLIPMTGEPIGFEIRWSRKSASPKVSILSAPAGDLIQIKSYTKSNQPSFAETLWRPSSFR